MVNKGIVLSALVAALMFAGASAAQDWHGLTAPWGWDASASLTTQHKRCENLGMFVRQAAMARDQHESESDFLKHAGGAKLGLGMTRLINQVFDGSKSPDAWQQHMQGECVKRIS